MKKIIFLTFVLSFIASGLYGATAQENFINFKTWGKDYKKDWLEFTRDYEVDKYNLLIQQHDDWFNNKITMLKKLTSNTTDEQKETFFKDSLSQAVNLVNKHMNEWKDLCQKNHDAAVKKYQKYKEQLESFARDAGIELPSKSVKSDNEKVVSGDVETGLASQAVSSEVE